MLENLYLVSCVSKKLSHAAPARELYRSTWFVLARKLIEREGASWYIPSAKHGLVHPDSVIAPYDQSLNTMRVADQRDWAARLQLQRDELLPGAEQVTVFAGRRYREYLEDYLLHRFTSVTVPMRGLRIGQQLGWLKHGKE